MYCHTQDNGFSDHSPFNLFPQFSTTSVVSAGNNFDQQETAPSNILFSNGNYYRYSTGSGSGDTSYVSSPSNSLTSYSNHPSAATTNYDVMIERCIRSHHSPHKAGSEAYSPLDETSNSGSVVCRRVFSTEDLEGVNCYLMRQKRRADSPMSISSENSLIIEAMSRATKYSPEEKKERIERYRNKRIQRNFGKKIQYSCRKTLADSRPRIKGRFARNEEMQQSFTSMTMLVDKDVYDHCTLDDQWSAHYPVDDGEDEVASWASLLEYSFLSHPQSGEED